MIEDKEWNDELKQKLLKTLDIENSRNNETLLQELLEKIEKLEKLNN
jgi:hypothetical protein